MYNKDLGIWCACISTNRAANVSKIEERTGLKFTFYTREGESDSYKENGAQNVVEVDGNICRARNTAIADAEKLGLPCLQISDDLKRVYKFTGVKGNTTRKKWNFIEAITWMLKIWNKPEVKNCRWAGTAITDALFHYQGIKVSQNKLVVNDCILLRDGIRFDEKADLKEDYDMFLTEYTSGRTVLRFDCVAIGFEHRENKGGANDYRTTEREKTCNDYLKLKWGDYIMEHDIREGQIKINYKLLKNGN